MNIALPIAILLIAAALWFGAWRLCTKALALCDDAKDYYAKGDAILREARELIGPKDGAA